MKLKTKLLHEVRAVIMVSLSLLAWLGVPMLLKILILEDHNIR